MTIAEDAVVATFVFQGKRYYFCSERCRRHFKAHPGWYVPIVSGTADPAPRED
jgi:YHS domain-containing protein